MAFNDIVLRTHTNTSHVRIQVTIEKLKNKIILVNDTEYNCDFKNIEF